MGLLDNLARITGGTNSDQMGQAIEELVTQAISRRKPHERRWYDNNFFDDGYHFRIISRKTGRVIDTASKTTGFVERAIPRASRQIRGVSNLLFASEPYPVVYPERISMSEFPPAQQDPQTGKEIPSPEYEQAMEKAKTTARKRGVWLSNEWEDEQEMGVKMIDMILKASKNSVSWLQVYSDPRKQKIITDVYDAFDIICNGDMDDERKLPFITKACPMTLDEIKNSPLFDPAKVDKLTPDNKYATSEVKDAYMRSRYGLKNAEGDRATVIVKETFLKEYLSDKNWERAMKLGQDTGAMEGKSRGDMIMRQVFSGGGVTLDDTYVDYDEYPLIPFRFEPGPLYQVPFIERFIPQNKSVDVIVTRLEKFVNAMVVGVYQKRKGENFQISNMPGGQVIEYEQQPLAQMNIANPGQTPFQVIGMLNQFIDEQGASTASANNLPAGVKSGVAIESLKATEYSNLKIPTKMLKQSIKRIAERMIERADKDYLKPSEVSALTDGEPEYFDVIGSRGAALQKKIGEELPQDTVVIDRKMKVRIEIEPGLGLTEDGKRASMQQISEFVFKLYEGGFMSPEAMQMFLKRFIEAYGYGSTEELMEALEKGITGGQMTDNQLKQIQIAVAQTLKDVGAIGPQNDKKLVMASKVGTLESMKEAGLLKNMGGDGGKAELEANQKMKDTLTKIYDDAPPSIRRQIEVALGMSPADDEDITPKQADTLTKLEGVNQSRDQQAVDAHVKTTQLEQSAVNPEDKAHERQMAEREMAVKEKQTAQNDVAPEDKAFDQRMRQRELDIKEQQAKAKAQPAKSS